MAQRRLLQRPQRWAALMLSAPHDEDEEADVYLPMEHIQIVI